ncbi:hypothetical protein JW921_05455 [Candidatus Fermentibacterales bacterium]|nr:hypothetical protein [Candidatus Fermentibacterales bacterium]
MDPLVIYASGKPLARWWWFSGPLDEAEITSQLEWLKGNGFGGCEIAWVYPLPGSPRGPAWLSPGWSRYVGHARRECSRLGLVCDLTLGSMWPFGDVETPPELASKLYGGPSPQRLEDAWDSGSGSPPGPIIDHLSAEALEWFHARMVTGLGTALEGDPCSLFCDSWEVEGQALWTRGFGDGFEDRFGYRPEPFMESLDEHPGVRYDYRRHLADMILHNFYEPLTRLCNASGCASRVQCHGSPTDLLAAYARADVPESESLLFDPAFSRIAASAAVLGGRPVVSAEAFTCLYGWVPRRQVPPFLGEERPEDLKLLADALFANGVNQMVWHGMPYDPPGAHNRFYANVHVGREGSLCSHLPCLNDYMTSVSLAMREGESVSRLAVYLPFEDCLMGGELPAGQRKPSARFLWEMQHVRPAGRLAGHNPIWLSAGTLGSCRVEAGRLRLGEAGCLVDSLLVDVDWLEARSLELIHGFAAQGLPVLLGRLPSEPGRARSASYDGTLRSLASSAAGPTDFPAPIIASGDAPGTELPMLWCRESVEGDLVAFMANPGAIGIGYPMRHGQALELAGGCTTIPLVFDWKGRRSSLEVALAPLESALLRVSGSGAIRREPLPAAVPTGAQSPEATDGS